MQLCASRHFHFGSPTKNAEQLFIIWRHSITAAYRPSRRTAVCPPGCFWLCDFCSSVREFARQHFPLTSGFLQIPSHDGHPCLRLTLPAAERVVVLHHLVVALAGRTQNAAPSDEFGGGGAQNGSLPKSRISSDRGKGVREGRLPPSSAFACEIAYHTSSR